MSKIALILAAVAFALLFPALAAAIDAICMYPENHCYDYIKNCDETGTDCGGSCSACGRTCSSSSNLGSINDGGSATGTTKSLSQYITEDWLKVTTNVGGRLDIDSNNPWLSGYDASLYDGCGGTLLCSGTGDILNLYHAKCSAYVGSGKTYYIKVHRNSGSGTADVTAKLNGCVLTGASIDGGSRSMPGSTVSVLGNIKDNRFEYCPVISYLQIDAKSNDGKCDIQRKNGNMQGISARCYVMGITPPLTFSCDKWTVPDPLPADCYGKTVYPYAASVSMGNYPSEAGNVWVSGTSSGFSGSITFPDCILKSVKLTKNCAGGSSTDCQRGDTIAIDAQYVGNCPATAYIQVDASGGCRVQSTGGDMRGIQATCTASGSCGSWALPAQKDMANANCIGKTVTATAAGIYKDGFPGSGGTWLDGITTISGDASVTFAPQCTLTSASIDTSGCGMACDAGEQVKVSATYTGYCPSTAADPAYVQVDANNL